MISRMQSIEARQHYKNSFVCATKIFKDEGILTFWSGAVPRMARLVVSGAVVFTMFVFCLSLNASSSVLVPIYEKRFMLTFLQVREDYRMDGQGRSGEKVHMIYNVQMRNSRIRSF